MTFKSYPKKKQFSQKDLRKRKEREVEENQKK